LSPTWKRHGKLATDDRSKPWPAREIDNQATNFKIEVRAGELSPPAGTPRVARGADDSERATGPLHAQTARNPASSHQPIGVWKTLT
jgi:hypothetical protein